MCFCFNTWVWSVGHLIDVLKLQESVFFVCLKCPWIGRQHNGCDNRINYTNVRRDVNGFSRECNVRLSCRFRVNYLSSLLAHTLHFA